MKMTSLFFRPPVVVISKIWSTTSSVSLHPACLRSHSSSLLPIFKSCTLFVCLFWYWVLWAVYVFWILKSCWSYHLQIFSLIYIGWFFVLLVVSFAVQKLLSVIRSQLFVLLYFFCLLIVVVQFLNRVWLWDPMDWSMPGSPALHYLLGFVQSHVHWVSDTI